MPQDALMRRFNQSASWLSEESTSSSMPDSHLENCKGHEDLETATLDHDDSYVVAECTYHHHASGARPCAAAPLAQPTTWLDCDSCARGHKYSHGPDDTIAGWTLEQGEGAQQRVARSYSN